MFKKITAVSLILILSFVLGSVAQAQNGAERSTIKVTGTALVTGAPDLAEITLGVETKDPSAEKAALENAHRMERIWAALGKLGLGEQEISTSGYNIYSTSQVLQRGTEEEKTLTTYVIQNRIVITATALESVGEIIDTALRAGANQVQGVRFHIKDKQEMQMQALQNAVSQAKRKAEAIAASAGVEIKGILSINEDYGTYAPMVDAMAVRVSGAKEASTVINAGDVEVSSQVTMIFWF